MYDLKQPACLTYQINQNWSKFFIFLNITSNIYRFVFHRLYMILQHILQKFTDLRHLTSQSFTAFLDKPRCQSPCRLARAVNVCCKTKATKESVDHTWTNFSKADVSSAGNSLIATRTARPSLTASSFLGACKNYYYQHGHKQFNQPCSFL